MITGAEINNKVDVEKEHVFISFSVEQVRDELEYVWAFDSDNPDRLGDHTVIVSDLWIQDAIEDALDSFSYEWDAWTGIRDLIVELVEERVQIEYKTKVSMVTGVLTKGHKGENNGS
jgi:hypothetical protein